MPQLNDIAAEFAAKGIRIITLNYQESLSIVQNYQNSYPDMLFLLDDGSIYSLYAQNNYIPLNYVLNHDFDQTVEYWKEGFNEDEILDTIDAVRSRLVVTLSPGGDSFGPGDTIGYDVAVKSWTLMPIEAYVVVEAIFPGGESLSLGRAYLHFTLGETKTFQRQHVIPLDAPEGDYSIQALVGLPPADLWSADGFEFSVVP